MLTDKKCSEEPHCPAGAEDSSPHALSSLATPGLFKKQKFTNNHNCNLELLDGRPNLSPKLALLVGHIERLT